MQMWEEDLNACLSKYHDFLEQMEPYPEWKDKLIEEVGKWFHMIHNNLEEGDTKRILFSKLVLVLTFRIDRNTSSD